MRQWWARGLGTVGRSSSEAVDRCSPGEGEREGIGLSVGVGGSAWW